MKNTLKLLLPFISATFVMSATFANQNLQITAKNIKKNSVRISVGKVYEDKKYGPANCTVFAGGFGHPLLHNGANTISVPDACINKGKISLNVCSNTQGKMNCNVKSANCGGMTGFLYGVPITSHFNFDGKAFTCTVN